MAQEYLTGSPPSVHCPPGYYNLPAVISRRSHPGTGCFLKSWQPILFSNARGNVADRHFDMGNSHHVKERDVAEAFNQPKSLLQRSSPIFSLSTLVHRVLRINGIRSQSCTPLLVPQSNVSRARTSDKNRVYDTHSNINLFLLNYDYFNLYDRSYISLLRPITLNVVICQLESIRISLMNDGI